MIAGAESSFGLQEKALSASASVPRAATGRFTRDGSPALEEHLERTCARVVSGIFGLVPSSKLQAIFLGGGYGRGEGGVLREGDADKPYNDLEFYVAIRGNRHLNEFVYERRLHVLGEILTQLAGVEVEFKITSLQELSSRSISMFSYDLVVGHRVIWSVDGRGLVGCEHQRKAESIPTEEATRLLMNRCSGLLFAREHLEKTPFTAGAADFVRRNIAKVQLALGDAILTVAGRYHWSCVERHRRLQEIAPSEMPEWFGEVLRHHAVGVEFKLHPQTSKESREMLAQLHTEISALAGKCWLWVESQRLGLPFASIRDYVLDPQDKLPGYSRARSLLMNLRISGAKVIFRRSGWRHPRQKIFQALALLLWAPTRFEDSALSGVLAANLGRSVGDNAQAMDAYTQLWARVR